MFLSPLLTLGNRCTQIIVDVPLFYASLQGAGILQHGPKNSCLVAQYRYQGPGRFSSPHPGLRNPISRSICLEIYTQYIYFGTRVKLQNKLDRRQQRQEEQPTDRSTTMSVDRKATHGWGSTPSQRHSINHEQAMKILEAGIKRAKEIK